MAKKILFAAALSAALAAGAQERIVLLNEGNWQSDNGKITYFEDGKVVSNQWFRDINGTKLGDTPNDIIAVDDNLMAIAVNWSNIVQFITADGKAAGATEDIPNNRCLATDGDYVYATSYAHECSVGSNIMEFSKGFVTKIDKNTFSTVAACEVGYEPDGVAYYGGHLFVANSGGYAFQENHSYEKTVSVINASDMTVVRTVDTGQINLCGKMSQSGKYLCVSSPGDYYEVDAATIILDCDAILAGKPDSECFVRLGYASTCNCTACDGTFYAIGSRFSYITYEYNFDYITIDPALAMQSGGKAGIGTDFPGTLRADLEKFAMPYDLYVNPYTGYIYATDAGSYTSSGTLCQWSPEGTLLGSHKVYINPAHFQALKPDGYNGIDNITAADTDSATIYNLQGIPVSAPVPGQIYICKGKKFIYIH